MTVIPFDRDRRPQLDTDAHDRWVEWLAGRVFEAGLHGDNAALFGVIDDALDVPSNLPQWSGEEVAAEVARVAVGRLAKRGLMVAVIRIRTAIASKGVRL